jgi:hypothetical protein
MWQRQHFLWNSLYLVSGKSHSLKAATVFVSVIGLPSKTRAHREGIWFPLSTQTDLPRPQCPSFVNRFTCNWQYMTVFQNNILNNMSENVLSAYGHTSVIHTALLIFFTCVFVYILYIYIPTWMRSAKNKHVTGRSVIRHEHIALHKRCGTSYQIDEHGLCAIYNMAPTALP